MKRTWLKRRDEIGILETLFGISEEVSVLEYFFNNKIVGQEYKSFKDIYENTPLGAYDLDYTLDDFLEMGLILTDGKDRPHDYRYFKLNTDDKIISLLRLLNEELIKRLNGDNKMENDNESKDENSKLESIFGKTEEIEVLDYLISHDTIGPDYICYNDIWGNSTLGSGTLDRILDNFLEMGIIKTDGKLHPHEYRYFKLNMDNEITKILVFLYDPELNRKLISYITDNNMDDDEPNELPEIPKEDFKELFLEVNKNCKSKEMLNVKNEKLVKAIRNWLKQYPSPISVEIRNNEEMLIKSEGFHNDILNELISSKLEFMIQSPYKSSNVEIILPFYQFYNSKECRNETKKKFGKTEQMKHIIKEIGEVLDFLECPGEDCDAQQADMYCNLNDAINRLESIYCKNKFKD